MNRPADWQSILELTTAQPARCNADEHKPYKSPLADTTVISVHGDDAIDFLHAQLSADCRALAVSESVLTAWCSPKGRVLFLLRVIRDNEGFLLLAAREQSAALCKRLKMFVLRAAVEITDLSPSHGVIRLDGVENAVPIDGLVVAREAYRQWLVGLSSRLAAPWPHLRGEFASLEIARLPDIRTDQPVLAARPSADLQP